MMVYAQDVPVPEFASVAHALGLELSEENDRRLYGMTPEKLRSRGVAEEYKCTRSEAKNLEDTFPSRSHWQTKPQVWSKTA